jgi:hypothetical protein
MLDGLELFERLTPDALGRGIGRNQVRELGFEVEKFVVKAVVVLVADGGLSQDIISVVVLPDFVGELGVTSPGFVGRHGVIDTVWAKRCQRGK